MEIRAAAAAQILSVAYTLHSVSQRRLLPDCEADFFMFRLTYTESITKFSPPHILKAGKAVRLMDDSGYGLSDLRDGECARVLSVKSGMELGRRLLDLGFVEGTRVKRLFSAPSGDPAAYQIRGAVIALRASDAAAIAVKKTMPAEFW